jgi:hypothetical protein
MAVDIQKMFNETLPAAVASNPDAAKEIGVSYQLDISGEGGGQWFLDCTAAGPKIEAGNPGTADCSVAMTAADFQLLMEAPQANGMKLFFAGKLKISGNPLLATKLLKLLELQ